jgi:hypothetical protein
VSGFNDRLYALLPTVIRVRDLATAGQPLRSALSVISEQVDLVEHDIAQLYDDWFIETCQEWVVPYIGDLIGYQVLHEAGEAAAPAGAEALALDRILIPRSDVANTVRARRRKGTLEVLPELARDVAGWPAVAVEFGRLTSITQAVNDLRRGRGGTVDTRLRHRLGHIAGPFDAFSRTVDLRGSASSSGTGALPTSGVGLFVPRYRSYPVSSCAAAWIRDAGDHCFTFSALGADLPLFASPHVSPAANPNSVALPIALTRDDAASPAHYGPGKSLALWVRYAGVKGKAVLVPLKAIVPADLAEWRHEPEPGTIAVDALRGRISFPPAQIPERVFVAYHYGFSFEIGAGEYPRAFAPLPDPPLTASIDLNAVTFGGSVLAGIDVTATIDGAASATYTTIAEDTPAKVAAGLAKAIGALGIRGISALAEGAMMTVNGAGALLVAFPPRTYSVSSGGHETRRRLAAALARWQSEAPARAIVELEDSEVYDEDDLAIELAAGQYLELRAASGARPIVRMVDWRAGAPDLIHIGGAATATLAIDGLVIAGGGLRVAGQLSHLVLRRTTLVPGWTGPHHVGRRRNVEPSIAIDEAPAALRIEKCILGPISVKRFEGAPRPLRIAIADSIIDADDRGEALGSPDAKAANVELRIVRSTVFGRIRAHSILLAENTLFDRSVTVTDRQHGCFRFCYVPPKSHTPSRFDCQPATPPGAAPAFISKLYGDPGYARLRDDVAQAVADGADDRSEIGAFHDLFLPQRKANLAIRLAEYVPAGVETSIVFVS